MPWKAYADKKGLSMLTILLLICITIFVLTIVFGRKAMAVENAVGTTLCAIAILSALAVSGLAVLIPIIGTDYIRSTTMADQKIKLYKEQNKDIEEKVSLVVDKYLQHEKETYKDLKPESKITLASMYPELSSNQLVQQQIALYNKNNEKLTKCRLQKIKASYDKRLIIPFS